MNGKNTIPKWLHDLSIGAFIYLIIGISLAAAALIGYICKKPHASDCNGHPQKAERSQ